MDLELCMASDDNYCMHMGICIVSVMENNQNYFENINVHILNNNLSKDNINRLNSIKDKFPKLNLYYYDVRKYFSKNNLENILRENLKYNEFYQLLGISAYSRLFLGDLLPSSIDRVLYLDSDTIVLDELCELFTLDLNDNYVAGVIDVISNISKQEFNDENLEKPFLNSGVLLINLEMWRDKNFSKQALDFIENFHKKSSLHDQNIINAITVNSKILIDPKFNTMSEFFYVDYDKNKAINKKFGSVNEFYSTEYIEKSLKNPVVVHFMSQVWDRPWMKPVGILPHKIRNPYNKCYDYYKSISPWRDINLNIHHNFKKRIYYGIIRLIMMYFPLNVIVFLYKQKY